ncbi:HD-like signal output (HDOD) protein [Undibacterium sp. GrIS 1.8]|uniref:HDOD domain-containing protein n=1 Tax=unclassified Undibacterium TaxID=2630295 RepID=UPI003392604F
MKTSTAPARTTEQSVDALLKTIRIPPRPSLLAEVQQELSSKEPDPRRLAKIIANDVGLAGSLMKLTNSSFFGLRLKASSVDHAVDLLGMAQCGTLMTGIIARQSVVVQGQSLVKFWDFSTKRAQAMIYLARNMHIYPSDIAHTFGLFCDIGIPIMLERFPHYAATLTKANQEFTKKFTEIEDEAHQCNHAAVGSLMARTWGLPEDVFTAILLHHDYAVLEDSATPEMVRALVAMALMSEYAIQKYHGQDVSAEWEKGGAQACHFLGLSQDEAADKFDELHEMFNSLE